MIKKKLIILFVLISVCALPVFLDSCSLEKVIPIPKTVQFEEKLSSYKLYKGNMNELLPSDDFHPFELSSSLFVNYAEKQRLVKIPEGTQMTMDGNGVPIFPEKTILVKTFYYYKDVRDPSLGRRIMETRLLIKEGGLWNVAAYVWNEAQTEATLDLNGFETKVSWVTANGLDKTITYEGPSQQDCVSCHQTDFTVLPLGPELRNLNVDVTRNGTVLNQLAHFQSLGILNEFASNQISTIVDYKDKSVSLAERGRAYLDMNCAHCHNPAGWTEPANKGFNFRNEVSLGQTKILDKKEKIKQQITKGKMPYLGTSTIDEEGVDLIIQYLDSL